MPTETYLESLYAPATPADVWLLPETLAALADIRPDPVAWHECTYFARKKGLNVLDLEKALAGLTDDEASAADGPLVRHAWPVMPTAAYHGVLGDIVRVLEPETEADPAALLGTLLAMLGNALGRQAHATVSATRHFPNLYVCAVGNTAHGRKGTSADLCRKVMEAVDPEWERQHITEGLSTGEGLIWRVRDPIPATDKHKEDPGITDKRCCLLESEFGRVLTKARDKVSIISHILRQAWDTGHLASLTSGREKSPVQAHDAHVSIIGHITSLELQRQFADVDAANGFGNRFLWLCVRRTKLLPHGGVWPAEALEPFLLRLGLHVRQARRHRFVSRTPEANRLWEEVYPRLTRTRHGLIGALSGRAEAHVLRLSMLYALLDGTAEVTPLHLQAALALWDYAEASMAYIFGDTLGDALADPLLAWIRDAGEEGRTRQALYAHFGGRIKKPELDNLLRPLIQMELVEEIRLANGKKGRPTMVIKFAEPFNSSKKYPSQVLDNMSVTF